MITSIYFEEKEDSKHMSHMDLVIYNANNKGP